MHIPEGPSRISVSSSQSNVVSLLPSAMLVAALRQSVRSVGPRWLTAPMWQEQTDYEV